jgi:hypothetical protein
VQKRLWEQRESHTFPGRRLEARAGRLWAVALGRFRDYMQLRKDTDMPLDTSELSRAYAKFDGVARGGDFGPPPPGEWDAEHTLAHVVSGDASIASAVLAVVAGQRPVYDNRVNQDESNLQWIIKQAGGLAGLADLVCRNGELLCATSRSSRVRAAGSTRPGRTAPR